MIETARLLDERDFHDRQASARRRDLERRGLAFADEAYLDHESWIRPAFANLGDVRGKRVLDFGCGHGMASVVLVRRGARVVGFDLSSGYVAEAASRARANGVSPGWLVADGVFLPFANESFDAVWGNAVLHHLDVRRAGLEIHRILKPGGRAVFCEPWGGNPLLRWARRALPYPRKHRTHDETPLVPRDLDVLKSLSLDVEVRGHQLLGMCHRLAPWAGLGNVLGRCDAFLLKRLPVLEHYCRYVVVTLRKVDSPEK